MTPPHVTFDDEELTLTVSGVGHGWTFGQLGHLSLFDQARVQFPSSWSDLHISVATRIVQSTWRLNSTTFIEQSLRGGISYRLADGGGGQMFADTALIEHLLERPLVSVDALLTVRLNGQASSAGFSGDCHVGLGLRGQF